MKKKMGGYCRTEDGNYMGVTFWIVEAVKV